MILSIDPGNIHSAYVVLDENLSPLRFEKLENEKLLALMEEGHFSDCTHFAVEMIASYGMAVGKSVFDTCVWIGRFVQIMESKYDLKAEYIYRKDEKMNLCGSMKAKDTNITQALVDRFSPNTPNKGKGSKKDPGFFYGFAKDVWMAFAVGVTYYDMYMKGENKNG